MVVIVSLHLQLFFCSSFSLGVDYCDFQVTAWLQLVFFSKHVVACVVSKHSLCHCIKLQCEPSKRICVETKIPAATTAGNPCLSNYWYHQGWWNAFVVVRTPIFRGWGGRDLQFISLLSICLLYFPITATVTDELSGFARHWHNVAASPYNDKQIGSVDWLWWETVAIIPPQLAPWAHTWVRTWLDLPFHFTRHTANGCHGLTSFGHGKLLRGYLYNLPPLIPRRSHIGSNIQG